MKHLLKPALGLLLFFSSELMAQDDTVTATTSEKQSMRSLILAEERELLVYTPVNTSQKLPLVIVFDGGGLFRAAVAATRFMNYFSEIPQMPEAIVLGIQNTDRNRDMPIPQQYGGEKGEDNFMKFVKDELIPWANKKYALNGHVILVGHSQGAYFASWLLAKVSKNFPWVLALDAPVNVSQKGVAVKEMISAIAAVPENKIRYVSVEAAYGWGNEWTKYFSANGQAMSKKLTDESHESMAFPGLYEGFKLLYKDFAPARKDMNLRELEGHYKLLSKKYGYDYAIPLNVLTASASRKIPENRKDEVMELLNYAELKYGATATINALKAEAAAITSQANPVVDSFLALPKPGAEQLKKYLGNWKGQMITKEGEKFGFAMDISVMNGEPKLLASFDPGNPGKKIEADVFHVTKDGELVFGIRNRGGGIIINILKMDNTGVLTGEGWWKGFTIPADAPADVKKQLNFLINTPTKFRLSKL